MKALVVIGSALAAILLGLLTIASANTEFLSRYFPQLLGLNVATAVALLLLVGYQMVGLWREYKARSFGSRLKLRLMVAFAAMALAPGLLVYAVSVQFATRAIDSWFDVRVDNALEGGLVLGRTALDHLLAELAAKGENMALDLGYASRATRSTVLNQLRERSGIASAALFSTAGQVLVSSSDGARLVPPMPTPGQLRQARQPRGYRAIEGDASTGLDLVVMLPVVGARLDAETVIMRLSQPVPAALAESAESVQEGYRDYQELSLARVGIKRIFGLTLTLALLLALFTAIAFAFIISRRMSAPLSILAEGTQAVMAGDFTPRQALGTHDELGLLTRSFSKMTRQLDEARALAQKSRAETETARAYLESVLAHISAGVLAFSTEHRLRAANRGAVDILGDTMVGFEHLPLAQWPRLVPLRDALLEAFDHEAEEWSRQLELPRPGNTTLMLLVRGSRMATRSESGFVVVFDDITQMLSAQRAAAWGEVARRLAHEIKNPLTPIQLSAERLQMKLAPKLDSAGQEILERSTRTIVNQVEAMKNLVNEFRDYARLPAPSLVPVDLNRLVSEVLALYDSGGRRIEATLADDLPPVAGDASQLRQVIHNLLQNAQDALGERAAEAVAIHVSTLARGGRVALCVADDGAGFPPHILAQAFEPYVTTKPKGTGLGLAIVKKIIDEHHGEIELANREPHGAQVRITLPLAA